MHINNKNTVWNVTTPDLANVEKLRKELGISPFLAKLISSSGVTDARDAKDFLSFDASLLHDPFLMPDMDKAVDRIKKAVSQKEKILIYGDYDVDGVTSVALLLKYLTSKGALCEYYIPERINEGYGLNNVAIDSFKENGTSLIITVDSGITAGNEVTYAKEMGIDVVITDHHECREAIPESAIAVVNPHRNDSKYPFSDLAGVGVVFKLVCALEKNVNVEELLNKYADIVALGTVADVMPILGENRVIVKIGLDRIENTENFGLRELITASFAEKPYAKPRKITTSSISFVLAPRINAAGRIGDVNKAVRLLVTDDLNEAAEIASYLCSINRERQIIENDIYTEAISKIDKDFSANDDVIIVLDSDSWHIGVIGIVASKLTDMYSLPSILISFDGNTGKGSGRSIKGFNINEAISECKEYLVKSGGHELAAGLTITRENVDTFRKKINEYAKKVYDFDGISNIVSANFEIEAEDVTIENALEIKNFEPYGVQNPEPLFYMKKAKILEITPIGEGKHIKLLLEKDTKTITAVFFGMQEANFRFKEGMTVDVMCNISINDFRGNKSVQLSLKDVRADDIAEKEKKECAEIFLELLKGNKKCKEELLPTLANFRTIYLYIKSVIRAYDKSELYSVLALKTGYNLEYSENLSLLTFNIALEVFNEMGLIVLDRTDNDDEVFVRHIKTTKKVDLSASEFLNSIRE